MIQFDIMYVLMAVVYSASIFGNYVATFYEPQQKRLIICSASQAGFVFSSMLIGLLKRKMNLVASNVAGKDAKSNEVEVDVEIGGPNFEPYNASAYIPPYHIASNDIASNVGLQELSITAPPSPYTGAYTQVSGIQGMSIKH